MQDLISKNLPGAIQHGNGWITYRGKLRLACLSTDGRTFMIQTFPGISDPSDPRLMLPNDMIPGGIISKRGTPDRAEALLRNLA